MSCSEDDKVIKHSFSWEDIRKCIDLDDVDNDCTLTSLCSHHYMIVYKCNKVLPVEPVVSSIFGIKRKREHSPSFVFSNALTLTCFSHFSVRLLTLSAIYIANSNVSLMIHLFS